MTIKLTNTWDKEFYDEIIDVRSPKEFKEDHIPYSINLPVLSNAERKMIGIIYKKESPFKAKKIGASLISKNISLIIKSRLYEKPGSWKPLIYCWRGGKRSKSLGIVLSEIGWQIKILNGGYRTYRKKVTKKIDTLVKKYKFIVISGQTGSAKSELLRKLGKLKLNIIDLEDLASHKGSLLGKIYNRKQPSQKMFESLLYQNIIRLDKSKNIFIENESSKIGNIHLPQSILKKIKTSRKINIISPLKSRVDFLIKDYKNFINKKDSFKELFDYAELKKGKNFVKKWRLLYKEENWPELALQLIENYYDPLYNYNKLNKKNNIIKNYKIETLSTYELNKLSMLVKNDFTNKT